MTIYYNPLAPARYLGPELTFMGSKDTFFNLMSDHSLVGMLPSDRITRAALCDIYGNNGATDTRRFKWFQRDGKRLFSMLSGSAPLPSDPLIVKEFIAPLVRPIVITQAGGSGTAVTLSVEVANTSRVQWFTKPNAMSPEMVPIEGATSTTLVISSEQVAASYGPVIVMVAYNEDRKTMTIVDPVQATGDGYESSVRKV